MSTKFWKTFSIFWKYGSEWWKKVYRSIIKALTSDIFLAIGGSLLVLYATLLVRESAHHILNAAINEAGLGKSGGLLIAMDTLILLIGCLGLVIIWFQYSSIKSTK